jgi:acetyltransferase-like isoleucine patch superfamily enzyme
MKFNSDFLSPKEILKLEFKKIGKNVKISKNCLIIGTKKIIIGDNVRIDAFTYISCSNKFLKIGDNTHIGSHCFIQSNGGITIGSYCGLGSGSKLISASESYDGQGLNNLNLFKKNLPKKFKYFEKKLISPIKINNHVIIGVNSTILGNVEIGLNTAIAAHSFVNKSLKGGYVYSGNPILSIYKKSKNNIKFAKIIDKYDKKR